MCLVKYKRFDYGPLPFRNIPVYWQDMGSETVVLVLLLFILIKLFEGHRDGEGQTEIFHILIYSPDIYSRRAQNSI